MRDVQASGVPLFPYIYTWYPSHLLLWHCNGVSSFLILLLLTPLRGRTCYPDLAGRSSFTSEGVRRMCLGFCYNCIYTPSVLNFTVKIIRATCISLDINCKLTFSLIMLFSPPRRGFGYPASQEGRRFDCVLCTSHDLTVLPVVTCYLMCPKIKYTFKFTSNSFIMCLT